MRGLLKNPGKNLGFSLIVIAVLALGIGANTALFSIVDRVLLHPLPFRGVDRLVEITALEGTGRETGAKPDEINFFAEHVHSFDRVELWRWQNFVLTGVDNTDSIFALEVSPRLFDTLGVHPALGRAFLAGDFDSAAPPVTVISDKLWRKHFRADPGLVGRQILFDGKGYTVVGIMGPELYLSPARRTRPGFRTNRPRLRRVSFATRLPRWRGLRPASRSSKPSERSMRRRPVCRRIRIAKLDGTPGCNHSPSNLQDPIARRC